MKKNKKIIITALLILISLVAVVYTYLDFSFLFGLIENSYPSSIIKRINVVLISIIVAISGKDSLNSKDSVLLKTTFIAVCFAELSFVLNSLFGGIVFFFIAQVLLILRNSPGLKQKLSSASEASKLKLLDCSTIILALYVLIFRFVFYPVLKSSPLLMAFMLYASVLSISLWIGIANYLLGLFPKKNSLMVCIGMACFFISDILVGLSIITDSDVVYLISNSFIWVLYIPAILLLALSGYKYNEL